MLGVLSVFLLIAVNAFFVTAEFAIVSVRRSRISQLVQAGDLSAQTVQSLQRSIERLLSTTQFGITLSCLSLGWIGEKTVSVWIESRLLELPLPSAVRTTFAHSVAVPVAFIAIAYLQIVLGELCPKSLALIYPEQLARLLAPPSLVIAQIFTPFVAILNQSTRWLLRLGGIQGFSTHHASQVTSEELQLIIATERESTGLEAEERELLNNVLEFGDVQAVEIMVPRTQLIALPSNASFRQLLQRVVQTKHSRYPVMGESLDEILGVIDFKELAVPWAKQALTLNTAIKPWVKPIKAVPESMLLSDLLPLMQRSHAKMVIVLDEFGGTAGLVTLQDVIDEIIGDEMADDDPIYLNWQQVGPRTYVMPAQMHLEEVSEVLGCHLPLTDDYQTLGGFLLYQFQKIPEVGESITFQGLEMTLLVAQGPRLEKIRIRRRESLMKGPAVRDSSILARESSGNDTPTVKEKNDVQSLSSSSKSTSNELKNTMH